jgi:putative aminopeptidase FrvX
MSLNDVEKLSKDPDARKIAEQLVEFLEPLIRIPSPSGKEEKIAKYLVKWIKKHDGWKHNSDEIKDNINNVYFIPEGCDDKTLPLLIVHSDNVKEQIRAELLADVEIKLTDNGCIDNKKHIQMGYDDKCGIAIILWLITFCKELKFRGIITVQEEECSPECVEKYRIPERPLGGCGIQYALDHHNDLFNSQWGLLLDRGEDIPTVDLETKKRKYTTIIPGSGIRQNESDIVCNYDREAICEKSFIDEIEKIALELKTPTPMKRAASPKKADAINIRKKYPKINLVNLATGGYKEHSSKDYVNMFQVVRTLLVVEECLRRDKELSNLAKAG